MHFVSLKIERLDVAGRDDARAQLGASNRESGA
jgi:hypothetical protein